MKYYCFIFVLSLVLVACKGNKQHTDDDNGHDNVEIYDKDIVQDSDSSATGTIDTIKLEDEVVDEYFDDPLVVSYTKVSDTMQISEDCVIFLWPDSLELAEIKQEYPEGYIEILDDMIYYASDAAIALNKEGIKNFFCDKSVIQFTNSPEDSFIERKKTEGSMIFFRNKKEPHISYSIDFDLKVCRDYFYKTETDSVTIE